MRITSICTKHIDTAAEEAPDVAGMDHSKLDHGVLGHAPSAQSGD